MENLEKSCVEKIHEKRNSWFTNDIDENDIENAFAATLRPFKAGKYYLLRASIAPSKNLVKMPTCFVFDESENKLSLDDIRPENDLITVLEIQGIKFTSKSFQFEIILRQALIMSNKPVFQSCVIKKNIQHNFTKPESTLASENVRDAEPISLEVSSVPQQPQQPQQPHIQHNLEQIIKSKNNIKLTSESQDDKHNDSHDNHDNNDNDTYNEDEDYNESVNKSDNNKLANNVQIKSSPNNLEKIESLELTELTDADLEINTDENMKLKKPNDIYYEIYNAAKEKARTARKLAFDAYLEVKKIKKTYMLDDSDSDFSNSSNSDDDDDDDDNNDDDDDNNDDDDDNNEHSNS
jgi:hypothetical protein